MKNSPLLAILLPIVTDGEEVVLLTNRPRSCRDIVLLTDQPVSQSLTQGLKDVCGSDTPRAGGGNSKFAIKAVPSERPNEFYCISKEDPKPWAKYTSKVSTRQFPDKAAKMARAYCETVFEFLQSHVMIRKAVLSSTLPKAERKPPIVRSHSYPGPAAAAPRVKISIVPVIPVQHGQTVAVDSVRLYKRYLKKYEDELNSSQLGACPPPRIPLTDGRILDTSSFELGEAGSYGTIYKVSGLVVKETSTLQLAMHERSIMKVLADHNIGPALYDISASLLSSECKGRLIVMEDVGDSTMMHFRELFEGYTPSLSQKIVEIGALILKQLEELHKLGFVHGDIHAKNIVLNVYPTQSVRLIDFGLTEPYVTDWGHHVENRKKKSADDFGFSNLKILSIFEVEGNSKSRRDDLYRLAQVLLEVGGYTSRYWHDHNVDCYADPTECIRAKQGLKVTKGTPRVLVDFLNYVSNLRFEEKPQYAEWIGKFEAYAYFETTLQISNGPKIQMTDPAEFEAVFFDPEISLQSQLFAPVVAPNNHVQCRYHQGKMLGEVEIRAGGDWFRLDAGRACARLQMLMLNQYEPNLPLDRFVKISVTLLPEADSEGTWWTSNETPEQGTSVWPIEQIFRGKDRLVFTGTWEQEDKIEKIWIIYQSNCDTLSDNVHPALADYVFMNEAHKWGIAPSVIFGSESMRLPTLVSPKTDFAITRNQYAACASDPGSSIEYLVIHAPAGTMRSVMEGSHPNKLAQGITMAIDIIRKLKVLHTELGIIHGNVNPDTVVFDKTVRGDWTYLLTGFQKASYVGEGRSRSKDPDCLSWSMWEDDPGFADDVYMALFTAGAVANQQGVYNVCMRSDPRVFHAEWFRASGVHRGLRAAIERVKAVPSKTEKPNYDEIIRILSQSSF